MHTNNLFNGDQASKSGSSKQSNSVPNSLHKFKELVTFDFKAEILKLETIILEQTKNIYYAVSNNAPNTYDSMVNFYERNGMFLVSYENCNNTIWTHRDMNIRFRAMHDAMHYLHKLKFTYTDELILGAITADMMPTEKLADLMRIEICEQIKHYKNTKTYVDNQREFTIDMLHKYGYNVINY